MMPPDPSSVRALFNELHLLPSEDRRHELDLRCGDDVALRVEVASLLAHHDRRLTAEDAMPIGLSLDRIVDVSGGESDGPRHSGTMFGEFRLTRRLGRGTSATVWEAEQMLPRRRVALKLPNRTIADGEEAHRFEREANLLARLTHSSIARIYGAGVVESATILQPYVAMEYVDGQPLDRAVVSRGLNRRATLKLLVEICRAVHHAHEQGIVHRDLKPSNVLIEEREGVLRAKVIDFGVARIDRTAKGSHATLTQDGQLIGTLGYMSPEQARGDVHAVDARSDVYALGVMIYESLCGRRAHDIDGLSFPEALHRITSTEPTRLDRHDPSCRGDLTAIVEKAIAGNRERRYANAGELADDLEHFLDGRPVVARAPGRVERAARWVRLHRRRMVECAVIVVAIIGIGLSLWIRAELQDMRHHRIALLLDAAADLGRGQPVLEFEEKIRLIEHADLEADFDTDEQRVAFCCAAVRILKEHAQFDRAIHFLDVGYRYADSLEEMNRQRLDLIAHDLGLQFNTGVDRGASRSEFRKWYEACRDSAEYGDGHEYTHKLGRIHAGTLISRGRFDEAKELLDRLVSARRAFLRDSSSSGANERDAELDFDLLSTESRYADLALALGNHEEAIELMSEIINRTHRRLESEGRGDGEDLECAKWRQRRAGMYYITGDIDRAHEEFTLAHAIVYNQTLDMNWRRISVSRGLGVCERELGNFDRAIKRIRSSLERSEQIWEPKHEWIQHAKVTLANTYLVAGREPVEALRLADDARAAFSELGVPVAMAEAALAAACLHLECNRLDLAREQMAIATGPWMSQVNSGSWTAHDWRIQVLQAVAALLDDRGIDHPDVRVRFDRHRELLAAAKPAESPWVAMLDRLERSRRDSVPMDGAATPQ